jgi:omega-6 fatty acid desaturase (delta-12 desaturase)
VHLRFPAWFGGVAHHVYDHAAHHAHPGIPCYRLPEAQQRLNALLGPLAVSDTLSLRWLYQVQRRCKLYDFERHRWLDFAGKPTSRITLTSATDCSRRLWPFRPAPADA